MGRARPQPQAYRVAVCTNSAFGGANAATVVGRADTSCAAFREVRPVYLLGLGTVGPHGLDAAALDAALAARQRLAPEVPVFDLRRLARRADPRGMDPSARYLTAAAAGALLDGGVKVRGAQRVRTGLIAGACRLSTQSARAFFDSIQQRGLPNLSAHAFARMVLHAPAGACSAALALRGPTSTLNTGDSSGLVAVIYAAQLLASHQHAAVIVAGGMHELDRDGDPEGSAEGAACLALGLQSARDARDGQAERPRLRIAGWGLAGPDQQGAAARAALQGAGLGRGSVDEVWTAGMSDHRAGLLDLTGASAVRTPAEVLGDTRAAGGGFACAAAARALWAGSAQAALVIDHRSRSTTGALVLLREA